jgi:BlaI family penicillinase repressor
MERQNVTLCPSEWTVMECLWKRAPQTLMELVRALTDSTDWSASTVKTLVGRMAAKGLLRFEGANPRQYFPSVRREDAAYTETASLLRRAYHGNLGMLVSNFVQRSALTRAELDELYDILKQAEEEK